MLLYACRGPPACLPGLEYSCMCIVRLAFEAAWQQILLGDATGVACIGVDMPSNSCAPTASQNLRLIHTATTM